MNTIKYLIIGIFFYILNLKTIECTIGNTCQQSWECGNVPFSICQNRFDLLKGIGVDPVLGKVYIMGKFNSSGVAYGNVTIASVSTNTPNGIIKSEFTIKSDVLTGSAFRNTYQLFKYLPKSKTFLTQGGERLSSVVGIYDDTQPINLVPLWYPRGFQLTVHFDEVNQLTYTCDFSVNVYNKIVKTQDQIYGSGSAGSVVLSPMNRCVGISNAYVSQTLNNTVIFAQHNYDQDNQLTTFYIGSANCVLCPRQFDEFAYFNSWITGFHIYNNFMYFSSLNGGIIQMNVITGVKVTLVNDKVDSMEFINSENTIYYIASGAVKKVVVDTKKVTVLYDSKSDKTLGKCTCSYGFTGNYCNECSSGIVHWENGNPTCVSLNAFGRASMCNSDWQCGNAPYTVCMNSECLCRPNFVGDRCDQCFGSIHWENGIPICVVV